MNWKAVLSTGALLLYAGTLYAQCELKLDVPIYDGQTWINGCDVQLNGVVSPDAGCPAVASIHWDWGDGAENDAWFPAEHTYSANGSYVITVTPYDSNGGNVTTTFDMEIAGCDSPQNLPDPTISFVPDLLGQFASLSVRPDVFGFGIGNSKETSIWDHYQGIARLQANDGTPYFFVSKSDDEVGQILVVEMGSRDKLGERMRSNRLLRDWPFNWTPPDIPFERDKAVRVISFDGKTDEFGNTWPSYGHPGGMQILGDVLAVSMESPKAGGAENVVLLLDVSTPERPMLLSSFSIGEMYGFSAAVVAITSQISGRYLMLVTGKNNEVVRFFESLPTKDDGTSDLKNLNLGWREIGWWCPVYNAFDPKCVPQFEGCPDGGEWAIGTPGSHQMLNFIREGSADGPLYLVGAHKGGFAWINDLLDLYRVTSLEFDPVTRHVMSCPLSLIHSLHVQSYPTLGVEDSVSLAAASGVYVSPSGELIIYATSHYNDGPKDLSGTGTVKAAEWRHHQVVRPNSPTKKPSVTLENPFEVNEGSSVELVAHSNSAITKAWIELYEDENWDGWDDSLVIDYEDWRLDKDNYDNLDNIGTLRPNGTMNEMGAEADSWRWFAPVGCSIYVFGDNSLRLVGSGKTEAKGVLDDWGLGDNINSMAFDCDAYYNAEIQVKWDFDRDGLFEILGETAEFSAEELDGPSLVSVPVRAQHPTDTTDLGMGVPLDAKVHVKNVPPSIDSFAILDSLGLEIGTETPVSLVHLEIAAEADFTDPGKPDTQTASLDWGDGLVEPHTVFDFFTDAFGGVIGQLRHTRIPDVPADFSILLEVVDDDGGLDTSLRSIRVVSASEAIVILIDQIDDLIATATDVQLIAALQQVRNQLIGNNTGIPENGALDKLASGDFQSALVMIEVAIDAIVMAEAVGAGDLSSFKNLLGLTAESVAQELYLEALDLFIAPSKGEAKQILKIEQSITDGHSFLLIGNYPKALDKLQKAVGLALDLISG